MASERVGTLATMDGQNSAMPGGGSPAGKRGQKCDEKAGSAVLSRDVCLGEDGKSAGALDVADSELLSVEDGEKESLLRLLRLNLASRNAMNVLIIVLIVAIASFHPLVMKLASEAFAIVPLLLLVVVFVYVVNPIVMKLMCLVQKLPGRQWFSYKSSLILTYLLLVLVLVTAAGVILPRLYVEMESLADKVPHISQSLENRIELYRASYFDRLPVEIQDRITEIVGKAGSWLVGLINGSLSVVGQVSSAVVWCIGALVLVPLMSFYILSDGDVLGQGLCDYVPLRWKPVYRRVLGRIDLTMQRFISGQLLMCFIMAVVTMTMMAFVLPEYCVALGVVAGVTESIPMLGPLLGLLPAVAIALAIPNGGIKLALIVAACYIVVQRAENDVLIPRVMGHTMGVHPLSMTLGMLVFGNMFGFWGVVFASPIVAIVKIVCEELFSKNLRLSRLERERAQSASVVEVTPKVGQEQLSDRSAVFSESEN